jgi:hypothetical protein
MSILKTVFPFIIGLLLVECLPAQPMTNIAVFRALIDSSLSSITVNGDSRIILPQAAALLENDIRAKLALMPQAANPMTVRYTVEHAGLRYDEIFRDGFFGDYYFIRSVHYSGSIGTGDGSDFKQRGFSFAYRDTLHLTQKDSIEISGYPITEAPLPAEPLFNSLLEPAIAAAAMGVTIYLLFTVRKSN